MFFEAIDHIKSSHWAARRLLWDYLCLLCFDSGDQIQKSDI